MNPTRAIRRSAAIVAGLAATLLAVIAATPAAFADDVPHPGASPRNPVPLPAHAHAAAASATPGWQIALIVAGAVLVAAAIAVLLQRTRAAQRRVSTTAA
jgi:hypothetical protein